ncbi:MAG: hypothetical protein C4315_04340 [Chloroflexota bacterium]
MPARLGDPIFGALVAACSAGESNPRGLTAWPRRGRWPQEILAAPPEVQEAYYFAVANPDTLRYIPCFCGCVSHGHGSNLDCYVAQFRPDGSVVLDPHAFG